MIVFELISEISILNQIMTTDDFNNSGLRFQRDSCITFLPSSMGSRASSERTDDDFGNVFDECICDTRFDFTCHLPNHVFQ